MNIHMQQPTKFKGKKAKRKNQRGQAKPIKLQKNKILDSFSRIGKVLCHKKVERVKG